MRRVIICREYPPTPGGGIGTYTLHIAAALAAAGDTVHVIGQRWPGAERSRHESANGRLVVHRLPVESPGWLHGTRRHRAVPRGVSSDLYRSEGAAAAFSWQAAELVEELIESQRIDLIEAPEYEAPLYFFQVRRALGIGPARQPPCVVHLHSPSEFVATANGMAPELAARLPIARLEAYSIGAADALLSPSHHLARQVVARFGLPAESVSVLPYPLGDTLHITRAPDTWSAGSILYLGRLELRKGVLEWIEAAVMLAEEYPTARFEFVGSDHIDAQLGGIGNIAARIPAPLRCRFVFHDHRDRAQLAEVLSRARLVVVPSRWENFPYTCIEAMASGVAVVASPEGGMTEMIENGTSGWVAASQAPADLAQATHEALECAPAALSAAGARAAARIRMLCDEQSIVSGHAGVANRLVSAGSRRAPRPDWQPQLQPMSIDAMSQHVAATAHWRDPSPGLMSAAEALGQSIRRGASHPIRTTRRVIRHVAWHLPGARS